MTTTPTPDLLTTDEVAALCRTSAATVRYWHHVGRGPQSFKVGRRRLYDREAVNAWVQAQRASA